MESFHSFFGRHSSVYGTKKMKKLSEMSLEELWQLFPIILKEYNPAYTEWYEGEKELLTGCIGQEGIFRISHIGSTAVPGLLAKPTADILLEMKKTSNLSELKTKLQGTGWNLMREEPEPLKLVFNKGYTPEGFAGKVFHLHVRYPGDWNELYFRDYLRAHPDAADEYAKLKRSIWKKYEHDRDGYTKAKTEFVLTYTEKARAEFGGRYTV